MKTFFRWPSSFSAKRSHSHSSEYQYMWHVAITTSEQSPSTSWWQLHFWIQWYKTRVQNHQSSKQTSKITLVKDLCYWLMTIYISTNLNLFSSQLTRTSRGNTMVTKQICHTLHSCLFWVFWGHLWSPLGVLLFPSYLSAASYSERERHADIIDNLCYDFFIC